MRKSFNGLGELIQHVLDERSFSGHLFIFRGRKGDTVKILWAMLMACACIPNCLSTSGCGSEPYATLQLGGCLLPVNGTAG
ncbi:TPA: IS66 family insertion sequence element accessory protein TnpB [Salmonella enterica subsp. enterica serovar Muenchen]|nr:transposase [Salmonella enterica subsp. enterica]EHX6757686.1 IS66 family insertion sequence element accessory protein TnpB [Salmonella enterica subsp. enterica serovar Chester]HAK0844947.1 transposase [Salmonella enterica]HEC7514629.1 IS66 family insertion sequence element accessory protein TnpB [Salmonella enterica subsp. enterica serovar Muenchen]EHZ1826933.1 IS66 family insertion sequence element accessory protein TnpB [Salmonella enterica subsp. enterica serovar Chester]